MKQETSIKAYHGIKSKNVKKAKVFKVIKTTKGATLYEIARSLRWPINCVTGRVSELRESGSVINSGKTKKNPTGVRAIIWVATK